MSTPNEYLILDDPIQNPATYEDLNIVWSWFSSELENPLTKKPIKPIGGKIDEDEINKWLKKG